MLDDFDKQIYLGVVFDLNNVEFEGRWITEVVKVPLMNTASKLGISGRIYVGGYKELPRTHGESVYQISAYQEEGDLLKKLKDVIAGVGVQDAEKFVLIFTNRLAEHNFHHYKKIMKINEMKGYENKICLICFGENYSRKLVKDLCKEFGCSYCHIESVNDLEKKLNQMIVIGA